MDQNKSEQVHVSPENPHRIRATLPDSGEATLCEFVVPGWPMKGEGSW